MSGSTRKDRARAWASGAALLGCATLLPSCNIIAPAYVFAVGPPKQNAMYTLDKERPTVVFVDDRASVLPRRSLRQTISQKVENELLGHNLLVKVVESRAIAAVASRDPADQPSDITTLGKSVSAEIVIYISLDRFGLSPDGQTNQPFADARVKVLDITREQPRVWPDDREGFKVSLIMPQARKDLPSSAPTLATAQEALAGELGDTIAKLFYSYVAGSHAWQTRD